VEAGSKAELPATTYHLAEQYHVGQPLALHTMRPGWKRFWLVFANILLGAAICAVLGLLANVAFFLFQEIEGQDPDELLMLVSVTLILLGCAACMVYRGLIVRNAPVSLLVCTEGMLKIRPKEVDVTRWDEVRGTLHELRLEGRMIYRLDRINRKPIRFGEVFENMEDLVNVVRQQLQR
jgi:hypothetical protein